MEAIPRVVEGLRRSFDEGRSRSIEWRRSQLDALLLLVREKRDEILDALAQDVGKPRLEAYAAEVAFMEKDILHVRKHLERWMRPEKVSTPAVLQPGWSRIYKDPLGVVLIIAPWNYPFQLALSPLVGAIAAGNCAVIKPSEVAPATSALIAQWLPYYLDGSCIAVVEGAVAETTKLLAERFDHIFYTGNGTVGRIVMQAAAKHLTPVTLELGGKSPCIVDPSADLDVAARRIVWGKFYNCGQTCVAPDYVLVHESVHDALVNRMVATVREFWGDDPQQSKDYGRIVNARHHQRLMALMASGDAITGGTGDQGDRYIAPTILKNVSAESKVMQDEIFGPILPVLSVTDMDAAIAFVNARPKPLALYLFASDRGVQEEVLARTSSGGVAVNHAILHLTVPDLPFGGVGESGMGAYHGQASFDTVTH
ncbi:MAG: aldehyde dehydrogenase family protein, partial [Myxococcales bacterium]|nr:aldehyde dehydrogenase family protein [Myxococcales bacterium]